MTEYQHPEREAITLPTPDTRFSRTEVEKILREVCESIIEDDRPFVFEESQPLIKEIASEIQQRIVRLGYVRYKMVTHVVISEAAHQSIRIASRCLWDPETDNYASYTYSTPSMHICVVTYGVYWE